MSVLRGSAPASHSDGHNGSGRALELLPTRAAAAYDEIKRQIIELELPPGSIFTEADIAASLGVSKTPARQALARLHGEGLIHAVPRSGYRVVPLTVKLARDLFDVRELLESSAVAAAAVRCTSLGPDVVAGLDEMRVTTYRPADRASVRAFLAANTDFHVRLARAGGNDAAADVLGHVWNQLERLFHLGITLNARDDDEVVHQHHEILDAVMAGDVEAAREVTRAEVDEARRLVLDALLSSDVILSANVVPSSRQGDDRR